MGHISQWNLELGVISIRLPLFLLYAMFLLCSHVIYSLQLCVLDKKICISYKYEVYIMIECKQSKFQCCCVEGFSQALKVTQTCIIGQRSLQIKETTSSQGWVTD